MIFPVLILIAASRLCTGEIWTAPNKLSSAEIEEILKLHNDYRATVGAKNMMELKWDPALADLAQGHAEQCAYRHTNMELPDGRHAGQNLAASTDGGFTIKDGFKGWISEIQAYDLKTLKCEGGWEPCGHLTQVLNARTQWVGCAIKQDCADKWTAQVVCDYFPGQAANVATFEHGSACSGCPGAKCASGLCSCANPTCIHGELDIGSCACACDKPYGGKACDQKQCPPKDASPCGKPRPFGFPKSLCEVYSNVPEMCPHMCGIC